ncbi:regulator of G-protein signaling 22 [Microcaecilia unicolor]|uniref:Regulator of G-protein signaling 22 n=1 Tax=Microcaecilia unicolor TaxID=1415580 RepID=A0A6P7ZCL9_9AMPH|nr:regulator of G-protein signaling 22 [Microcaecilia unicolor]
MREKRLTTEPPVITEHNFADLLATDDLLADYFNEFLSLPVFTQPIKFNRIYGNFEVIDKGSLFRKQQLKKIIRENKSKQSTNAPSQKKTSKDLNTDLNYTVVCLNRNQGLQWIKKERLPIFLASDCYFEYRLAKLLSQLKLSRSGLALRIDSRYHPWPFGMELYSPSRPSSCPQDENQIIAKKFFASFGQASFTQTKDWFSLAKQSQLTTSTPSIQRPLAWGPVHPQDLKVLPVGSSSQAADFEQDTYKPLVAKYSSTTLPLRRPSEVYSDETISENLKQAVEEYSVSFAESPSPTPIRVYIDQPWETGSKVEHRKHKVKKWQELDHTVGEDKETAIETIDLNGSLLSPNIQHLEEFAADYVERLLKGTIERLMNQPTDEIFDKSDDYNGLKVIIHDLPHSSTSLSSSSLSSEHDSSYIIPEFRDEELCLSSESEDDETSTKATWYANLKNINTRKKFEKFKSFLKGTIGEKNWWLWMDIERLRSIKDPKRQQRHLNKMRKLYLVTGEDHYMHAETLLKLGLRDGNQWNPNHLYYIQTRVVKPLLLYWGPRYCLSQTSSPNINDALKMWQDRQLRQKKKINPFSQSITLLPFRAKSCVSRISPSPLQNTRSSSPRSSAKKDKQPRRLQSASVVEQRKKLTNKPSSAPPKLESTEKQHTSNKHHLSQSLDAIDRCLRPQTRQGRRGSRREQLKVKDISGPLGRPTIESMLHGLGLESRAGYYFTRFCEQSMNELWKNNVNFWFDLQNFHHLFNQETLQPFKLTNQAKFLYATYLAPAATMDTGVTQTVKSEIHYKLDPPFDDLFDSAEEFALTLLLSAWTEMTELDNRAYGQVKLEEETRQLDMKSLRYLYEQYLEKKSTYKTGVPSPADAKLQPSHDFSIQQMYDASITPPDASFSLIPDFAPHSKLIPHREPSSIPEPDVSKEKNYWEDVPEEFQSIDLGVLSLSKTEMAFFHKNLVVPYEKMDLNCWEEIEHFRRMPHTDKKKREEMSKEIKRKYLNKNYFFGTNSPASKEEQDQIMQLSGGWGQMLQDTLPSSVLPEVQTHVRRRIEKKALPEFLATKEFKERHKIDPDFGSTSSGLFTQFLQESLISLHEIEETEDSTAQTIPPTSLKRPAFEGYFESTPHGLTQAKEVSDDQPFQAKRKKHGFWKDMEIKWLSPSKDMITFRKALGNPITAKQFQRYISLTDEVLETGLLFWLEVQNTRICVTPIVMKLSSRIRFQLLSTALLIPLSLQHCKLIFQLNKQRGL